MLKRTPALYIQITLWLLLSNPPIESNHREMIEYIALYIHKKTFRLGEKYVDTSHRRESSHKRNPYTDLFSKYTARHWTARKFDYTA